MNGFLNAWRQYATLGGRTRRREYWSFLIVHILILVVLGAIWGHSDGGPDQGADPGIPARLYMVAAFLPALAVTVRRLHDSGRSGWWVLISLVPLLGMLILLIFMLIDSQPGTNAYGPDPKGRDQIAFGENPT